MLLNFNLFFLYVFSLDGVQISNLVAIYIYRCIIEAYNFNIFLKKCLSLFKGVLKINPSRRWLHWTFCLPAPNIFSAVQKECNVIFRANAKSLIPPKKKYVSTESLICKIGGLNNYSRRQHILILIKRLNLEYIG